MSDREPRTGTPAPDAGPRPLAPGPSRPESRAGTGPRLRDRPWLVGAIWLTMMFASAYEIVPASVAPVVMADLGVDATAVSWLIAIMFGVPILASIPVGLVSNRLSQRWAVVGAGATLVVAGVLGWQFAARGAYWPLLGTRLLAALGYVVGWNASLELFGRFANRATATGLFVSNASAGFALGHVTGPHVVAWLGVPAIFLVYVVPMVPLAAVLLVASDLGVGGVTERTTPDLAEVRRLLRDRAMLAVCLMGFLTYSLYLFVNSWVPSYLNTALGISIASSGLLIAVFPLMGTVSRTGGGLVADRLFAGRRRPVVLLSFVVATLALAVVAVARAYLVLAAALVVSGFFVQLSLGLFYSYVPDLLDAHRVTGGVAVLTTINMGGAFSAPLVAGALIESTGAYEAAFGYALAIGGLGTLLAWRFPEPE